MKMTVGTCKMSESSQNLPALMVITRVPAPALNSRPALKSPWISENWKWPWTVLEKNGRPWKVWNLSIVKVSTRLGDCVNCRSCCKAGRRTAQTVLLINITHQCFKSVHIFCISRAVCYRMIDWKKGILLALNYWMKRSWKALDFIGLLAQEPCITGRMPFLSPNQQCQSTEGI